MTSKIQAISSAYSRLRISGITVQPTAGHVNTALERLEDMMAELSENRNICVNYNFEDLPDANAEMGVSRGVKNMIESNLAYRLAPDFNKIVPDKLRADAVQSLSGVSARVAAENLKEIRPPNRMPVGSGHRYRERYQRFNHFEELPKTSCKVIKMTVGEANTFTEHFDGYLVGESIQSFTIESSSGINVTSSAISGGDIVYTVQAVDSKAVAQAVLITVTTNTNRIEIRKVDYEVTKLNLPIEFA